MPGCVLALLRSRSRNEAGSGLVFCIPAQDQSQPSRIPSQSESRAGRAYELASPSPGSESASGISGSCVAPVISPKRIQPVGRQV